MKLVYALTNKQEQARLVVYENGDAADFSAFLHYGPNYRETQQLGDRMEAAAVRNMLAGFRRTGYRDE